MCLRRVRAFVALLVPVPLLLTACRDDSRSDASHGLGASSGSGSSSPRPALFDGSFEHAALGWKLTDTTVVDVGLGAAHGSHVLLFDPGTDAALQRGVARTRLPTKVGREYRLSFVYQAGFDRGTPFLTVTLDGRSPVHVASVIRFFDPGQTRSTPSRSAWQEESFTFFAERELTELELGPLSRWQSSIGWGKVWIDHVRLEVLERERTLGRDLAVRATLPSRARVGEELELTVSLSGRLERGGDSGGVFDLRPQRHGCQFQLTSSDPAATLPASLDFAGQALRTARVRFATPGVQRLTLRTTDGFQVLSNPVLVEAAPAGRAYYWGDIHVHTAGGHSDWVGGEGSLNYALARKFADLDFAALSEHFYGATATGWMERLVPASEYHDAPGRFVTFLAVESFGYQGHTNHYLRGGDALEMFDPRNPLPGREEQLANLRTRGTRVLSIPHHFMLLDPADWRATDRESLRLAEIYSIHGSSEEAGAWWRHPDHFGFAYDGSRGARGHDYLTALARGHRVGVIACSDSHEAQPGMSGLTCVRASELTREGLWDALYERACYATTGARILLDFELSGAPMGSEMRLAAGTPLLARLEVHGQAPLEALEIVQDGRVVASVAPGTLDRIENFDLGPYSGQPSHVYARVRQTDLHRAWTSPIWIDPAGRANPVLENRDLTYAHAAGALAVTLRNHGDRAADVDLRVYSSRREPSLGLVDASSASQPMLLLRLEPAGAARTRVFGALYLPVHLRRSFQFSGELQIQGANPNATLVVADPRGMLVNRGNGRFVWSAEVGVEYRGLDSLSGQITDFELLVDTLPDTQVVVSPKLDAAPLAQVFVGVQAQGAPNSLVLPVGRVARMAAQAQATVTLDGGGVPVTRTFPGLVPDATYVAVLGALGPDLESAADDNSAALSVPFREAVYVHWPEYLLGVGSAPGFPPRQPADEVEHQCQAPE